MFHLFKTHLWRSKVRAFSIHFGCSLAIALLAALLVFGLWYPYPFREISGGRELFLLIVGYILKFESPSEKWISILMIAGTFLFSMSIYFLSFSEVWNTNLKFLGPITPIGGLLMIISWAMLTFYFVKTKF